MNLHAAITSGKPRVTVPAGTYVVEKSLRATIRHSLEIHFEPGARLVAADGFSASVLHLAGDGTNTIKIVSPSIDVSRGTYGRSGSTNTGISLSYFRKASIYDVDLFGGKDWASRNGDSGISTVALGYTLISGGVIRGFMDAAVYPGGDNTGGNGGVCDIVGVHVYDSQHAVTAKREMTMCRIDRMHVENCTAGCIQASVINGHYVGPAQRMHVTNSTFRKVTANVARFLSDGTGVFAGNTVEDWGRYLSNGRPAGGNAIAVAVLGAQGVRLRGNDFIEREWIGSGRISLMIRDHMDADNVDRPAGGVVSSGNDYGVGAIIDRGSITSHFQDIA